MSAPTLLVERLRKDKWHVSAMTCEEAADEIERLQSELAALRAAQPEPVAFAGAAEWLRNHYQDHPTIDGLCSAMRAASPPPAQPCACNASLRLFAYSGGADDAGLYGRLWVNVEGESAEYVRAAQPKREPLTDEDIKAEFAKLYPKDIGILELAEHNPDYRLEAIGARHHWSAFLRGARAIERLTLGEQK